MPAARSILAPDLDLVLAADVDAMAPAAPTVASHLDLMVGLGLRPSLLRLRAGTGVAAAAPRIARRLALGQCELVEAGPDPVGCRLILLYDPTPAALRRPLAPLAARTTVVVVTAPETAERLRPPGADELIIMIEAAFGGTQIWVPADPSLRRRLRESAPAMPLHAEDLPPFEHAPAWRSERPERAKRTAWLGRVVEPGERTLPPREEMLAAYPATPKLRVHVLGDAAALQGALAPVPANWHLFRHDEVDLRRFLSRLDFLVHHAAEPAAQAPRSVLQAMATGRVVIMPPAWRPLVGDGPAYRPIDQVLETVRYLQAAPHFYRRYAGEQAATLARRFSPEPLLRLLAEHLRLPRPPGPARRQPGAAPKGQRPIVFYPTNGVGLGHVTRLMAIARRLSAAYEPVFLTPCHALPVIEHAGYRTEYVPEHLFDETDPGDHARAMAPRLAATMRHYEPAALVFDGNVPRPFLIEACAARDQPMVWVRRGMWRGDPSLARHLELSRYFDAVIEPKETAEPADVGATRTAEDDPIRVPPVMLLDAEDLLPRAAARKALGLDPGRTSVLVQLGSGNNNDIERHLDQLVVHGERLGLQLVVAEWLIQHNPVRRRGIRYLSAFPNARYFRAFDLVVSAAGYNSFHELLHHGMPCIFLPNDNQKVDDQRARALFAEQHHAALCVPAEAPAALGACLELLLDKAVRRAIARRARELCPANGAAAAARAIEQVIARG